MAPPNRTARVAVLGSSVQRSKSRNQHGGRSRSALVRRLVLVLLVLGALALLTVSFRSPTFGALHDVQSAGASALRPFQIAAGRVARPFRDGYNYLAGLSSAKSENAKLRLEVRKYRAQANANLAAAQQTKRLKQLLHYEEGPTYPADYRSVNTSVLSFPSDVFAQQVTIAAGGQSGLHIGTPVVTADGLAGHATNVYSTTAQVMLLTDPESSVTAFDVRHHVRGLIRHGQGNTLIFDRVPKSQIVQKGDVIVTQGTVDRKYPDLYPYGIPIGTVISVGGSDVASFLTVQVAPFVNFDTLDSVAALISTKAAQKP